MVELQWGIATFRKCLQTSSIVKCGFYNTELKNHELINHELIMYTVYLHHDVSADASINLINERSVFVFSTFNYKPYSKTMS